MMVEGENIYFGKFPQYKEVLISTFDSKCFIFLGLSLLRKERSESEYRYKIINSKEKGKAA